jgi:hypothetical protein
MATTTRRFVWLRNYSGQFDAFGPMQILQRWNSDGIGAEKSNAHFRQN